MLLGLLAAILVMVPFRAFMYNSDNLRMFFLLSLFQNAKTWFCQYKSKFICKNFICLDVSLIWSTRRDQGSKNLKTTSHNSQLINS